ncbi:MAG: Isoquinoline 1-oxidoreductase [Hyphomicrobiales bacterium]|nr:Isoquinoline 1-oxidoreductase [Hyphomicrobiales bacterium]
MNAPTLSPSRRGFLTGAAGLGFAFTLGDLGGIAKAHAAETSGNAIGYWVTIHADGGIQIAMPAAEMGQGSSTALAMVFAEELDADWSKVSTVDVATRADIYGNPAFGGSLITVGSKSIQGYWDKVRLQAASVRRVLMQAAAAQWYVPLAELTTEPSVVVHAASGRRLTYSEIAAFAVVPAELPVVQKSELKPMSAYRIIGTPVARRDIPLKVDGSAKFGMDVQVPGMAYGTILRSPSEGASPKKVDEASVAAIPGIIKIVPMKDAVGIVAETIEAAFAARGALQVEWSAVDFDRYASEPALIQFVERAKNTSEAGLPFVKTGDSDAAFAKASKIVTAEYTTDYLYHAQMEPINITASVNAEGDGAEIWMGTQSQSAIIGAAAAILKTKPEKITLHPHFLGGGFGRRSAPDMVPYALGMSKAVQRPVKVIWTREQDVKAAKMRPMTAHRLEAAVDEQGNVTGWRHRIVAESIVAYTSPERLVQTKGLDPLTLEGAKINYEIPNQTISYLREIRGTPLSAWRGIGAGHNKFAIEGFADEVATALNVDPVAFRLQLCKSNPRATKVIKTVAEMAGWGDARPAGRAVGFAFGEIVNTWTAAIVEISLDRETGEIRAHRAWVALDPGIAVNPDSIVAQTEGNVVFGLSQVLKERVTISSGSVDQTNLFDYRVARMSDTPEIHVTIISTDNPPTGMGEAALPLIGPAVANAMHVLTKKRFRNMPLIPQRVKEILKDNGSV